jgi:hypothetical protein
VTDLNPPDLLAEIEAAIEPPWSPRRHWDKFTSEDVAWLLGELVETRTRADQLQADLDAMHLYRDVHRVQFDHLQPGDLDKLWQAIGARSPKGWVSTMDAAALMLEVESQAAELVVLREKVAQSAGDAEVEGVTPDDLVP